jgi:hypothetical protein
MDFGNIKKKFDVSFMYLKVMAMDQSDGKSLPLLIGEAAPCTSAFIRVNKYK